MQAQTPPRPAPVAPTPSEEAEKGRSKALDIAIASQSQEGFWIRDGENFINVQTNIDGETFKDVTIIEVNSSNKISTVMTSEVALFDGKSLEMDKAEIFSINASKEIDEISLKEPNSYNKTVSFDQDLIDSLKKEPEDLTTWNIIKQIQFLSEIIECKIIIKKSKPTYSDKGSEFNRNFHIKRISKSISIKKYVFYNFYGLDLGNN